MRQVFLIAGVYTVSTLQRKGSKLDMRTELASFMQQHPQKEEAEAILRRCVHCGFCNATCPTYQLLGDENDGPRGRIYLIKQVLEGQPASKLTQQHLDRCLTCRSCESTCPSGVEYVKLLEIGRTVVDHQVGRSLGQKLMRRALQQILPRQRLFQSLLQTGRRLRPILPAALKHKVPLLAAASAPSAKPLSSPRQSMVLLTGCVQPALAPTTNPAAVKVLAALGIELQTAAVMACCGAVGYHLDAKQQALQHMKQNIDQGLAYLDQGATAILISASGCGLHLKQYAEIFASDPDYASKASRFSAAVRDLTEVLEPHTEQLRALITSAGAQPLAWHSPCTLQHGQKLAGRTEALMRSLGIEITTCQDAHLCCGSAGTYSILQSALARQLRDDKLAKLERQPVQQILTANIGCQTHLQSGTATPVSHWIDYLAQLLP